MTTLDNGVRILTKQIPNTRSVSMGIWVNVGARDESLADSGMSHFIEHMLFKGTQNRTGYEIAKEFDAIGGQTNAFTSMENTCYHARVIDSHAGVMADILSDIFLNSVFDPGEIEKERPVILQEISMVEDNPDEYVHTLSSRSYWGDNPLGRSITGSRETVNRFDTEKIKAYFKKYYQPRRIVISAAGNITHGAMLDLMGETFSTLSTGNGFPQRITPAPRSAIDINMRQLEQVHICVNTRGIGTPDSRRYAFSLMNTILGGNMSSRLFQKIREERGLAYSVYAYAASFEECGMFGAYAGTDAAHAFEVVDLILKEMRRIKTEKISREDLTNAKEYTKGALLLASESVDNQMVRLAQNEINLGHQVALEEITEKIDAVTAEEIMALAHEIFESRYLSLTTLGPVAEKKPFEDIFYL